MTTADLNATTFAGLKTLCTKLGLALPQRASKAQLVTLLAAHYATATKAKTAPTADRTEAARKAWATRIANGYVPREKPPVSADRTEAANKAWATRRAANVAAIKATK